MVAATERLIARLSPAERAAILGGTGARVYGIDLARQVDPA